MVVKYLRFMVSNYLFAIIALVFTIMYWASARTLPAASGTWSNVLLMLLVPLFIWNFINSVIEFRKTVRSDKPESEKWNCTLGLSKSKIVVVIVALVYVLMLPILGFVIATLIFLAGLAFFLGIRKPIRIIAFSVVYTVVLYAIFVEWLSVALPKGIFF